MFVFGGLLMAFVACVYIYLSSRHQLWIARQGPLPAAKWTGVGLLTLSLVMMTVAMQVIAAVFTLFIWVMMLFVLFPYLGVLYSSNRGDK
ncbi:hypothetical protein A9Q78_05285 [Methylophaga sp. 41_12_T18]|nr:hypothetical protein A9Q78_05285 [Methylophaga sp. 41_12_T18]